MSAAVLDTPPPPSPATHSTGPKTPEGKAASARNALTHGLHAKETVLPHLGKSQAEYDALHDGLTHELRPRTAVERHYVQQVAQAMWRLRRLTRWEAGLYDDLSLTDEECITRLARVLRHDAALRRHIDRALKALRDGPTNCQNEPPPSLPERHSPPMRVPSPCLKGEGWRSRGGGLPASGTENCQNEPAADASSLPTQGGGGPERGTSAGTEGVSSPPAPRAGALRRARKLQQLQQRQNCQNEPNVSQRNKGAENKCYNHRKECGE